MILHGPSLATSNFTDPFSPSTINLWSDHQSFGHMHQSEGTKYLGNHQCHQLFQCLLSCALAKHYYRKQSTKKIVHVTRYTLEAIKPLAWGLDIITFTFEPTIKPSLLLELLNHGCCSKNLFHLSRINNPSVMKTFMLSAVLFSELELLSSATASVCHAVLYPHFSPFVVYCCQGMD